MNFSFFFFFLYSRRGYFKVVDVVKQSKHNAIFSHILGARVKFRSATERDVTFRSDDVGKAAFYEWRRSLGDQSVGKDD